MDQAVPAEALAAPAILDAEGEVPPRRPPTSPPPPLPQPQAAKPILASALLENLLRQRQRQRQRRHLDETREKQGVGSTAGPGSGDGNGEVPSSRFRSGCEELDDYVLFGGMERGAVVGISGDGDDGGGVGRLISLHLLVGALLSDPSAQASIIDTTGSFPVPLLAKIIQLRATPQLTPARDASKKYSIDRVLSEIVQDVLSRVAISRAFDIEGVWEVLSEISADYHSDTLARKSSASDEDRPENLDNASNPVAEQSLSNVPEPVEEKDEQKLEIDDSEAEDDDIDSEVDHEEADMSHSLKADLPSHNVTNSHSFPKAPEDSAMRNTERKGRIEIIIIDNMTAPINELFSRRERSFAHTLLTTFSRTIHTLSQSHNILPILLNTLNNTLNQKKSSLNRPPTKPISVFGATIARPALGRLFSDLCALHLFITTVPKTAKDVQALYDNSPIDSRLGEDDVDIDENSSSLQHQMVKPEIQYAYVIEVLKDTVHDLDLHDLHDGQNHQHQSHAPLWQRQGSTSSRSKRKRKRKRRPSRCQRWAPFIVSADGLKLQNAFSTGVRLPAPTHAMHLVKQFPFGRRV